MQNRCGVKRFMRAVQSAGMKTVVIIGGGAGGIGGLALAACLHVRGEVRVRAVLFTPPTPPHDVNWPRKTRATRKRQVESDGCGGRGASA
ncbi:MAG TPA: hypothetical protein VM008_20440 [Phycisphaerae bacterium]|nr:hypothetical protein [Phycisphaerae bacterium]